MKTSNIKMTYLIVYYLEYTNKVVKFTINVSWTILIYDEYIFRQFFVWDPFCKPQLFPLFKNVLFVDEIILSCYNISLQ